MTQEPEIQQSVLDEALMPELSEDFFEICGQKIQIKPLKVRHQIAFTKTIAPATGDLGYETQQLGWMTAVGGAIKHADLLPKLVFILVQNDDKDLTEDQILDSTMSLGEMAKIIMRFVEKNEEIGKPIADFFTLAWPGLKGDLVRVIEKLKSEIQNFNITITASSKGSASNTDGPSNTPSD